MEDLDLGQVFGRPAGDGFGVVRFEVVQDQKDLLCAGDQWAYELHEQVGVHDLIENRNRTSPWLLMVDINTNPDWRLDMIKTNVFLCGA